MKNRILKTISIPLYCIICILSSAHIQPYFYLFLYVLRIVFLLHLSKTVSCYTSFSLTPRASCANRNCVHRYLAKSSRKFYGHWNIYKIWWEEYFLICLDCLFNSSTTARYTCGWLALCSLFCVQPMKMFSMLLNRFAEAGRSGQKRACCD